MSQVLQVALVEAEVHTLALVVLPLRQAKETLEAPLLEAHLIVVVVEVEPLQVALVVMHLVTVERVQQTQLQEHLLLIQEAVAVELKQVASLELEEQVVEEQVAVLEILMEQMD
jgi:hypothetical protein